MVILIKSMTCFCSISSAYCGSLWLAALCVAAEMAEEMGLSALAKMYKETLKSAQKAYIDKLWNGEYFNFDENSRSKNTIMADQLCGYWFLQSVSPELADKVISSCFLVFTLSNF